MAFHLLPQKHLDRHSIVANVIWWLVQLLVSVLYLLVLSGFLPVPTVFMGASFLLMTCPNLIVLNMTYEITYSAISLLPPIFNVILLILSVAGVRMDGHHPELSAYSTLDISFYVGLVIMMAAFPISSLVWSHYENKIPRFTFLAYMRFMFSNAYILFLINLPDFSVLLLQERPLQAVESLLTSSFLFSVVMVGIFRADVETRLKEGFPLTGYFFSPRYLLMMLSEGALALSSGVIYAIRIYSSQTISDHSVAFGVLQCALMSICVIQKITMVYSGLLLSPTYTSMKKPSNMELRGLSKSKFPGETKEETKGEASKSEEPVNEF